MKLLIRIGVLLLIWAMFLLMSLIGAFIFRWIWNWNTISDLIGFRLPELTYWNAYWLIVFKEVLFGSTISSMQEKTFKQFDL